MRRLISRALRGWRSFYGHHPLHLLLLLGSLTMIGYVVSFVDTDASRWLLLAWFVGAVIANDLLLYPLYALADRSLALARWAHRKLTGGRRPRVRMTNYVRIPTVLAGVLALISLPTITAHGQVALQFTSTHTDQGYLGHWLAITTALFTFSALLYLGRVLITPGPPADLPAHDHGHGEATAGQPAPPRWPTFEDPPRPRGNQLRETSIGGATSPAPRASASPSPVDDDHRPAPGSCPAPGPTPAPDGPS